MPLDRMFPESRLRDLAAAAGNGDIEAIDRLVREGVDVNGRGNRNATPLFWAMRDIQGFTRLLEHGADPNAVFDDGGNVMLWAVRHRTQSYLIEALKHGGDPNIGAGIYGEPLIFEAMGPAGKNKAVVLLESGANINARGHAQRTPMMKAAGLGQFDLVYELLNRGADYTPKALYGNDLLGIIKQREKTMDPNNSLTHWMHKVIDWLASQNVAHRVSRAGRPNQALKTDAAKRRGLAQR